MYSLTKEEYDQLKLQTSHVPGQENEYLITIEVFHQLHCLVLLPVAHVSVVRYLICTELSPTTRLRYRPI